MLVFGVSLLLRCPSRLTVVRFRVERMRDGSIVVPVTAQTRPTSQ